MSSSLVPVDLAAGKIVQLRADLAELRAEVRKRFDQGATGVQVASTQSSVNDRIIESIWKLALAECNSDETELLRRQSALIAVGGSGRGEAAPYSDIDLLFLHAGSVTDLFHRVAGVAVRACWDVGVKIGHSIRTPGDALRMARGDISFCTSLVETRLLWGSESLHQRLMRKFARLVQRHGGEPFLSQAIASRRQEREECGGAVQQLEPDVKRAFGGLRDVHLIRWIGFARHGVADLNSLKLQGAFDPRDGLRVIQANDYLLGIRNELHFAAGRPFDTLTREEQVRIAERQGFEARAGRFAVERFMQRYFEQTTAIADVAERMARDAGRTPAAKRFVDFVMTYWVDGTYRIGPNGLDVPRRHLGRVTSSLEEMLKLFLAAARYQVTVSHALREAVREALRDRPPEEVLSPEASKLFLQLLKTTGKLGHTLRTMYGIGLLEAILPSLRNMRCLLQFNQYHSYTVDEHTLRAVEAAERLEVDPGAPGRVYKELKHKELLFLALLLHDAGKGFEEDHSEVGQRLAVEAVKRLGLPEHQGDLLVFLVHRHLLMAHLAFRRDTSDPEVLLNFSREVGSADALRLLYILTVADISAVGPGAWTDWKAELIATLYDRCLLWLSGKSYLFDEPVRLSAIRGEARRLLADGETGSTQDDPLEQLPPHYLLSTSPRQIAEDLDRQRKRQTGEIVVDGKWDAETGTVEYRVLTDEKLGAGCFHKITGALTAKRMEILSAHICTSSSGAIIDSYRVRDLDHAGEIPEFRMAEVAELVRAVLSGKLDVATLLRSQPRFAPQLSNVTTEVSRPPLRVTIDNESSDRCTVIDIFALDKPGLLYAIARTLYDLELSLVLAKISTHFDQVVDVFYVTGADGRKIRDGNRLRAMRAALLESLDRFYGKDATSSETGSLDHSSSQREAK